MKKIPFFLFLSLLFACSESDFETTQEVNQSNVNTRLYAHKVLTQDDAQTRAVSSKNKRWETGQTIKIEFLNGNDELQNKVKEVSSGWLTYANLKFEFVSSGVSDVRIYFAGEDDDDWINWSYIGTDSKFTPPNRPNAASMNLGWTADDINDPEFAASVLQQFGLMLGLNYEHKNPTANVLWSKTKLRQHFTAQGWASSEIDAFTAQLSSLEEDTDYTEFDGESIMVYSVASNLSTNGYGSSLNLSLSEKDKTLIGQIYPFATAPDDFETLPKNHRTVFHTIGCTGWDTSVHGLNHYNYDEWLAGELDNDGLPNGNYKFNSHFVNSDAEGTYKVIDCDEISFFTQSIRIHTGRNVSVPQGYLGGLDVRQSDLDGPYFFGARKATVQEFDQLYGGYYPWGNNETRGLVKPERYRIYSDNSRTSDITSGWGMPTTGEILQLVGEAPRRHNDFWKDMKDFFFASAKDDFITNGSFPLLNSANISGLTFAPGGIVQNITYAFERPVKAVNFGKMMTLLTTRHKFENQAYLTTFNENGANVPAGIRIGYWIAWGGNVRYSRVKTADELGYRLVADNEEDKVTFELPSWTNPNPSRYTELITNRTDATALSDDTALERGVTLRYSNRKARTVAKKWSEIKAEAKELRGYLSVDIN